MQPLAALVRQVVALVFEKVSAYRVQATFHAAILWRLAVDVLNVDLRRFGWRLDGLCGWCVFVVAVLDVIGWLVDSR